MKIILGITGGIAAYKAPELVRFFVKRGIGVEVVMTEAAARFVTPLTLQALSGRPVHLSQWEGMIHIDLSRDADAILVAPATADFIAKIANGHADDLLSSLCLARDCPLHLAPAMNRQMWENPSTKRNIERLKEDGIRLIGPEEGLQACGETGFGRMTEPEEIASRMIASLSPKSLAGKRFLITAGPTLEPIDPVRVITNLSSGKMGYAIARAAIELGAEVVLVSGPTALLRPEGVKFVSVRTAREMLDAVMENISGADVFVSVAAVSDYHVANASREKIKKSGRLVLELEPNPDILKTVANLDNPPYCVGFAAETENLHENAVLKLKSKKVPMIVGNLAKDALGADENEIEIFTEDGSRKLPRAAKAALARQILVEIGKKLS
ncbi:MAG TPA: bifunctional phosphopantothenoylcysteine decarboxylase/phosphopantothenate--cysteine ligase CoaBC [Burkholderiales bacterium]|nr:bifunctional phosphopantothenoylcysteine decarboxylase/phosphopantothenate--cysteine ligase CoaBC [Burkholderiales bacterium]